LIIDISRKFSTGVIPFSTSLSMLSIVNKKYINKDYGIDYRELEENIE